MTILRSLSRGGSVRGTAEIAGVDQNTVMCVARVTGEHAKTFHEHNDNSIKDLCDIYALVTASGDDPRTLRSRLHRLMSNAPESARAAMESPFLDEAAGLLRARTNLMRRAVGQLA